jgi:hypothetical protein
MDEKDFQAGEDLLPRQWRCWRSAKRCCKGMPCRESVLLPIRNHAPHPAPGVVNIAAPTRDEVDVGVKDGLASACAAVHADVEADGFGDHNEPVGGVFFRGDSIVFRDKERIYKFQVRPLRSHRGHREPVGGVAFGEDEEADRLFQGVISCKLGK